MAIAAAFKLCESRAIGARVAQEPSPDGPPVRANFGGPIEAFRDKINIEHSKGMMGADTGLALLGDSASMRPNNFLRQLAKYVESKVVV